MISENQNQKDSMNTPTLDEPRVLEIMRLASTLDQLLPFGHSVNLCVRRYAHPPDITIDIQGVTSYEAATEIFRTLGIQKRQKQVYSDMEPRTVLQADLAPEIHLTVYCAGLPPSCHVETYVERIPKAQTVETSEFIEVPRLRIVCGAEVAP